MEPFKFRGKSFLMILMSFAGYKGSKLEAFFHIIYDLYLRIHTIKKLFHWPARKDLFISESLRKFKSVKYVV